MRASDRARAASMLARVVQALVLGAALGWALPPCVAAAPAASAQLAKASAAASAPKANATAASAPPKTNTSAASAPKANATAASAPPKANATAASTAPPAAAAKSVRVKVLFVARAGQAPQPAADATVRLQGSEQSVTTNVDGVAEVFGTIDAKAKLVVIVVNAAKCLLPLKSGASVTVVVPRKGQGSCSFGA